MELLFDVAVSILKKTNYRNMLLTLNGPAIPPVFDRVVITCCSLETGVCRWHYKPSVFCILAVNDSREIKIYYHHICIIVAPDICHCCHMNIC